jgi:hypothetical protein
VTNLLPTLNPYALPAAEHPVFVMEARHMHKRPPVRFWRFLWAWIVIPAALFVCVALLLAVVVNSFVLRSSLPILLLAILGFGLYCDISALLASINTLNRDFVTGRMDLLRLAPLTDAGLIAAKHALTLLRTRRITLMLVSLRLGLMGSALVYEYFWGGIWFSGANLVVAGLQLGLVLVIAFIFAVEPFWRVEMMTALGIYLSSLNRSQNSTLLLAGFSLGIVGLFSLMIVGMAGGGLMLMASLLLSNIGYSSFDASLMFGLWFNVFFLVLLSSAIFGFYHIIERWCLRHTFSRLRKAQ